MKPTLFDFEDGRGPVPAHRHPNGGGWVAETAHVDETAYVGPDARVSDYGRVFGNGRVSGGMHIKYGTCTSTPVSITRSDGHTFTLQPNDRIVAGCRDFSPEEADAHWGNPAHHLHAESVAIVAALQAVAEARKRDGK